MNAKIKYIVLTILILVGMFSIVYAYKHYTSNTPTDEQQCENGSLDACKIVIQKREQFYKEMTQKIAENSSGATEYKIKYCSNLGLDAGCYDRMVGNEKLIQSNQ